MQLCLAQNTDADQLLSENPFALLVGMLLDQQVPMETAFSGPKKIADRMSGFDAAEIADYDPDKFADLCSEKPAIHRFPGSMAKRIQTLAQIIVDRYDGDAAGYGPPVTPMDPSCCDGSRACPGSASRRRRYFWHCSASSTP